jgi:hypothetical protein
MLAAHANHFQLPCPKTEAVIGQKDNRVETEKFPEIEDRSQTIILNVKNCSMPSMGERTAKVQNAH